MDPSCSTTIMVDTRRAVIQAMENVSPSQDPETRRQLLNVGLKEMIRWFTLAARVIVQKKIQLPKQTLTFMQKHRDALEQLANTRVDDNTKRQLILKPGGSGFLGGVMIRSLLRWDGQKTARKFGTPKKKKPARSTTSKKRAGAKKKKRQPKRKTNLQTIDDRFVTRRRRRPVRPLSPTPSPPSFSGVMTSTPLSSRQGSYMWTPVSSSTMSQTPSVRTPLSQAKWRHTCEKSNGSSATVHTYCT